MEYFIWQGYFPGSGYAFAETQKGLSDEQAMDILAGAKLTAPPKSVRINELSEGKLPDVLESAWSSKIVSQALQEVLKKSCPECVQFFSAKLNDYPDEKFSIANVLTKVEALDREKSKVTTFPRPPHAIKQVSKLVLKPLDADTPAIFHLAEMPSLVLVSETLRKELEAASSTAGRFIRVQDYRHPQR